MALDCWRPIRARRARGLSPMSSGLIRFAVAGILGLAGVLASQATFAQEAKPATPAPAAQAPAAPSPAPAAPEAQKPTAPEAQKPTAPEPQKPPGQAEPPGSEASTGETLDLPARPFAYVEGKADKDEIYSAILA